ncbi:MAG: DUF58 domain-containing protein [Planctomycetota bacterium]
MTDQITEDLLAGQQTGARYCLAAPRRAPQGTAGAQLGRLAGESMEFMDHREYQPGDDLRRLDWAAYGRSDKMIVKLYRQEVRPHLDLVIDGSRSMALPQSQKSRATWGLAAALCTAAGNAGQTHRAYLTGRGCRPIPGGTEIPAHWKHLSLDSDESPPESFQRLPPAWRPHGIRVILSDLLWLGEPRELLATLGARAAAVYVIQILASEDISPTQHGNLRLVDSESEAVEEVYLDAAAVARYCENIRRNRENWRRAARQTGAVFVSLAAEEICHHWDFSPLVEAGILTVARIPNV